MKLTSSTRNLQNHVRALEGVLRRGRGAYGDALAGELRPVLAKAAALAPIGEGRPGTPPGRLRQGGYMAGPYQGGTTTAVYLGFDVDGLIYPLIQHENLGYAHPRGGQAKFLEQPLLEWTRGGATGLAGRIAKRL